MFTLSRTDQQAFTTFLQSMVQTASFSGMEGSLAQLVASEMTPVGFDDVKMDEMGNVIGRIGSGHPPHLLYYCHLDTVGIGDIAAWRHDPFAGEINGGILYGRGAAAPKSSLAGMIYGAKMFREKRGRLNGTLYVAGGVYGEAAEGVAMQHLIEAEGIQPKWVILGAPSSLTINRGQRGRLELEVTIQGRACHAAMPTYGVNAIYGAARIIFSLELMSAALGYDDFLGTGSLAVTHIENIERTKNVIPDRCTFVIDRRLTLGETAAHALAEVQGLLAKEGIDGQVRVAQFNSVSYTGKTCAEKKSYPVWVLDEKNPLIKSVSKSVQRVAGYKPKLGHWNFSTAGVYTMGVAGIPTLGFGPGKERYAYTATDQVNLKDCFTAAEVYAQIAKDLLG